MNHPDNPLGLQPLEITSLPLQTKKKNLKKNWQPIRQAEYKYFPNTHPVIFV